MSEQRVSDKRLSEVAELVQEGHIDAAEFEEELLAVFDDLLAARAEIEEVKRGEAAATGIAALEFALRERAERERDGAVAVCYAREGQTRETVYWRERAEKAERELARVQPVIEAAREADWWFDHSAQNAVDGPYDFDEEAAALRQALRALDATEPKT